MPSASTIAVQTLSVSTALIAAGGNAALSLFDIPILQSQPASRSLPAIRWLFSRGSHIFPQAAVVSSVGFLYLAYDALPQNPEERSFTRLLRLGENSGEVGGFVAAALLCAGILPWTAIMMIPTNFKLIQMNEDLGGTRSHNSAQQRGTQPGERSAQDSVNSKGQAAEFADLSGPQTVTAKQSTPEDDVKARELLGAFARLNAPRGLLLGAGGLVGLVTALAG